MFEHLRYMGGEIRAHSRAGEFTVGRLDLNDPKVVEFRNGMINILSLAFSKMDEVKRTLQEAQTILDDAGATKEDKDVARAAYDEATKQVAQLQRAIDGFLG
jgi:uncharacterized iron-regulated protein